VNDETLTRRDGSPDSGGLIDLVSDVPLQVTVEIGGARMLLRDVLELESGSVVELDRETGQLADVLVNGRLVARGDVTAAGERVAVRIVELVGSGRR
jgi:flagellar motor switch protein FliN/FliY